MFDTQPNLVCASDDAERAYQKILRMASVREISTFKAREKLLRAGFSEHAIEEAISKAQGYRYIDDERYCDALIRSRIAAGKGLSPVLKEIESLGIDPYQLESYIDYLEDDAVNDLERAMALLNRRPPASKNKRDGAFRKLMQAGYSTSVASQAARTWATGLE